jgi:chromatin remodeling complex protein RSC6
MAATHLLTAQPALAAILGTDTTTRTDAVRGLWAYIRTHGLQRGKYVELDDKLRPLAAALQPKTLRNGDALLRTNQCHFLGMASLVAKHVGPADAPTQTHVL